MTSGLHYLHSNGWVHGDLSPGNIILFDDFARLTDLESAMKCGEAGEHDSLVSSGCCGKKHLFSDNLPLSQFTEDFAAVEVISHKYLFYTRPRHHTNRQRKKHAPMTSKERLKAPDVIDPRDYELWPEEDEAPPPTFRYNALHDLESLWWIGVSFLVAYTVSEIGGEVPEIDPRQLSDQRSLTRELFAGVDRRLYVFQYVFGYRLQSLPPCLRRFGSKLDQARKVLLAAYDRADYDVLVLDLSDKVYFEIMRPFYETVIELKALKLEIYLRRLQ